MAYIRMHETIRMLNVVVYPIVFILFGNRDWEGEYSNI